ncbi:hypothetical protein T265_10147 [Opisthorchis viverrini]|uniref:Uncharacterized protein n=1 Tax=Opisthorchis viverrini TaxID=6198 RepID=A0A074Z3F3_OPIVI|nr:hypothetical protein T265_10147 [Opisthorchis viverrini]KER21548.1 hypothetical protein T265_10147 [Opisthorchis viverrini]
MGDIGWPTRRRQRLRNQDDVQGVSNYGFSIPRSIMQVMDPEAKIVKNPVVRTNRDWKTSKQLNRKQEFFFPLDTDNDVRQTCQSTRVPPQSTNNSPKVCSPAKGDIPIRIGKSAAAFLNLHQP